VKVAVYVGVATTAALGAASFMIGKQDQIGLLPFLGMVAVSFATGIAAAFLTGRAFSIARMRPDLWLVTSNSASYIAQLEALYARPPGSGQGISTKRVSTLRALTLGAYILVSVMVILVLVLLGSRV